MSPFENNATLGRESYFLEEEVSKILDEQLKRCKRGTTRNSYNRELNYAIISFAFITGARASEICSVTVTQAKKAMTTGEIKIIGKGGMNTKDRTKRRKFTRNLTVPTQLQNVIAHFLSLREGHETKKSNDMLFIGYNGNPLTRFTLWSRFQTACRQAGVEEKKLHSTRHSAGMMGYGKTKDIMATKELLGHRTLSSTMVYVRATDDSVRQLSSQLGNILG